MSSLLSLYRPLWALLWLICLAITSAIPLPLAAAPGLSVGLAAVDEGDDRYRPAAQMQATFGPNWSLQLHTYGRQQAPVTQTSYLLAGTRNYGVFGFKALQARVGMALAYDRTEVNRQPDDARTSATSQFNAGLYLGLSWQSSSRCYLQLDWGSSLFPAGAALIFLTTARRQNLSAAIGWQL